MRILFTERQSWNESFEIPNFEQKNNRFIPPFCITNEAKWFSELKENFGRNTSIIEKCRFDSGYLCLEGLSADDLVFIAREIAKKSDKEISRISDQEIKEKLEKIDENGIPLYAYFLGKNLSENIEDNWSKYDLLDEALEREFVVRWKLKTSSAPPANDQDQFLRLHPSHDAQFNVTF